MSEFAIKTYTYCTDFIINLANWSGLSYFEINALIFILIWPALTLALALYYVWLRTRYHKLLTSKH